MTRVALIALIVFPLALARAQSKQSAEFVRSRISVAESDARTKCTVVPHRELYVEPPVSHECRVVSFDTLPRGATGSRWSYVVQRHTTVYRFRDSAGVAKPDTMIEIETILFSARDPRLLTAIVHAREEEQMIRSITPDVADRPGERLVSVEFCVNGTGGCWQEFWRGDVEGWSPIADPIAVIQPRVLQAFNGDSSHQTRSPRIDVRTLRGVAQIAARGDGNCCPSHRAEFQLAFDADRLGFRVVQFRVVANDR